MSKLKLDKGTTKAIFKQALRHIPIFGRVFLRIWDLRLCCLQKQTKK